MWRCRKEKDNSLTVLTEREGGRREGGRRGMRWEGEVRRRRRASTCSSDAPWRDGGMEGWREGRCGPRQLIPHSPDMFTVHWRQSDLFKSAPPAVTAHSHHTENHYQAHFN